MKLSAFASLLRAIWGAWGDYEANVPLPPSPALTEAQIAAKARAVQAALPPLVEWLKAHPGAIRGADRILTAAKAAGWPKADEVQEAVDALQPVCEGAQAWLPTAIKLLDMFQPHPTLTPPHAAPPTTADEPLNPEWGHDPRAENPSGAVGPGWTPPDP